VTPEAFASTVRVYAARISAVDGYKPTDASEAFVAHSVSCFCEALVGGGASHLEAFIVTHIVQLHGMRSRSSLRRWTRGAS
jgi:hypothetical protein